MCGSGCRWTHDLRTALARTLSPVRTALKVTSLRDVAESQEEQWAAAAVCRATGAISEPYDHSGRIRAVDYLLALPDGTVGALEVTSHAEPGSREVGSLLAKDGFHWPNPGYWEWSIAFDPGATVKEVRGVYAHVIAVCEQHGVDSPDHLPYSLLVQDKVLWRAAYEDLGVRFHGTVGSHCVSGRITVLPGPMGGGVDETLTHLPARITELLAVPHVAAHVQKLLNHPTTERHLFVVLGLGAIPFPQYYPLCSSVENLPQSAPAVPGGITHLWFSTGYGPSLVGWSVANGWTVFNVFSEMGVQGSNRSGGGRNC
jgi:hypothetical protein